MRAPTATAGGAPGTAKATTNAPVFKVDVANGALTALLDQNGLNIGGYSTGTIYMVTGIILLLAVTLDTVARRLQVRAGR